MSKIRSYRFVSRLLLPFLEFVYPSGCFVCGRRESIAASKLCSECWKGMARVDAGSATWRELREKFLSEGIVDGPVSRYRFEKEGAVQQAIHMLKYGGIRSLGVDLGRAVGEDISADARLRTADYCVPVPLHTSKLRERGYNQSEYICRGISSVTGIALGLDYVSRSRPTQTQTKLALADRRRNVSGAFLVNRRHSETIAGKHILLVDDVITSGSTVSECALALRNAGALNVTAVSAALAT